MSGHHDLAIDNLEYASASRVKTDPRHMLRVRVFQLLVFASVVALGVRFVQMAGMQIPMLGG